jgi:hypothetical protein
MNEERGAALRLLYQMKLGLEKQQNAEKMMTTTGLNMST